MTGMNNELVARLEAERVRGIPRWTLRAAATYPAKPVDHTLIPQIPVDINAAKHRQVLEDLRDEGLRNWRTA